jgi:hypothetical protein
LYQPYVDLGVAWLTSHQNRDGSWFGEAADERMKLVYTSEAVQALNSANARNSAYYQGIAWLENHTAPNTDYSSRLIRALAIHGDLVNSAIAQLADEQEFINGAYLG